METKKQKAIREAYGEYWERVKKYTDEDGWAFNTCSVYDTWNGNYDLKDEFHRPKTLQGIETNNGWISIESESDLPKENYGLYHVISKEYIYRTEPRNQNIEEFWGNDKDKSDWWTKNITHYQPIIKPQPPIY